MLRLAIVSVFVTALNICNAQLYVEGKPIPDNVQFFQFCVLMEGVKPFYLSVDASTLGSPLRGMLTDPAGVPVALEQNSPAVIMNYLYEHGWEYTGDFNAPVLQMKGLAAGSNIPGMSVPIFRRIR